MFAGSIQKAPNLERLFYYLSHTGLTLLLLLAGAGACASPLCPPNHIDRSAQVAFVYDGDTVRLNDGEKVRLIGINTPERPRKGKPAQPLANEATRQLKKLLRASNNRIGLRFGQERRDRYGRLLAYIYNPEGDSLSGRLLEAGLATTLFIPPNLSEVSCYQRVEASARQHKRGIWALRQYQVIESTRLPKTTRGYRIIRGRVGRVGQGRKNIWLNLPGKVAVRIEKKDLIHFKYPDPRNLKGKVITARGWLYERKGELRMRVQHPYALEVITAR